MRDPATPTRDAPLRRLAILGLVFVGAILSCGKDITGPGGGRFARGLSWNAIFPPVLRSVGVSSGVVDFTHVHVVLHHSDGTIALDTVVNYPSNADSVTVSLSVPLLHDAPAAGEPMTVNLGYIDAAGDTVFKGGPISLLAAPAPPGGGANPPVQVPVAYTGPGATATSVVISPRADTVVAGAPFTFTAVAKDAGGNAQAGTPIVWATPDTLATITAPNAGVGVARAIRGTARIAATLLTGATDTARLVIILPASQIVKPATASGDAQTGTAGAPLAQPIVAKVAASDGVGVAGTTVTFAVATGGGSVGSPTVVSDANGLAQTTWTLGPGAGAQSVTATAGTLTNSPLTYTATSTAAAASKLVVTTQPVSTSAGAFLSAIVVTAEDANGNVATSFTGPVAIALGTTTSGAALNGTASVNAVAGVATFSTLTINKAFSGYTLIALASGLTSATTSAFNITVGLATTITAAGGTGQTGTINAALPTPISVRVTDAAGNGVAGKTVTFATADGSVAPPTGVSDANGLAQTTWTLGARVSPPLDSMTATVAGLANSPLTITATGTPLTAGAATHLVFSVQPSNGVAGVANSPAIVVQALDVNNLLATTYTGAVTLAVSFGAGSSIGGTLTVSAVAGVATFSAVTFSKAATGYVLLATGTTVSSTTSNAFNIVAGPAANLVKVTGDNQAGNAGATLAAPVTIQVTDASGNGVSGTSVTFAIATGGGSLGTLTTTTNSFGNASSAWTLGPGAGTQTMTVTSATLAGSPATFTATSALPGQRTWTGAALDNQWSDAGNWAPAGVPASGDSVVVPAVASLPILSSATTIKALTLASGGTLTVNGAVLTVNGTLDATGGIVGTSSSVVLTSASSANAKGVIAALPLTVQGTYVMSGGLSSFNLTVSGSLDLNGQVLIVGNGGFFTQGTGTITMNQSGSNLSTSGPANFAGGDETGKLTAGTLAVGGSFSQGPGGNAAAFNAGTAHTLVLNGSVGTTLSMANPVNSIIGNLIITDAAGVTANTGFITNNLTLAGGALNGTLGGTINGTLTDPSGNWKAGNISFATSATPVSSNTPTITASNVTFNAASAQLAGNVTINGSVSMPGGLLINGHSLTITGDLTTISGGLVSMTNVADVLTINGNATFSGGQGLMSNGVLTIGGNFTQNTVSNSFNAGAGHTTRFTGATPTISFANPTTSNFGNLQLQTSGAVTFGTDALVSSSVWLKTGATPSVVGSGHTVTIGTGLFDTTGGRWQVANTVMNGTATIPRALATNLTISNGGGILVDSAIVTGNVVVTGATTALGMNGHKMKVSGTFGTVSGAILQMSHSSDSLIVAGNVSFNGGNETGQLSAGYLEIDGPSFVQGTTTTSFAADAPHVTAFLGTTQQAVSFANPASGSSHFGNLSLQDTAAVLGSDVFLNGQLQASGQASYHIETSGSPQLVTSNGANLTNVVFDNVRWKTAGTNGSALFPSISNVTFKNIGATTLPQFDYEYSTKTNLTLSGFTFSTTPTGGGSYITVVGPDTLTMSGVSPAANGGFLSVSGNGAINNWLNATTWVGTFSTAWATAGNWSAGVPTTASDVIINSASFQPTTGAAVTVKSLTVNNGSVLSVTVGNLQVNGLIDVAPGGQVALPSTVGILAFGDVVTDTAGTTGVTQCTSGSALNIQSGNHNVTGKFCNLALFGNAKASGPIKVVGSGNGGYLEPGTGGNLTLNGYRVDAAQYNATGTGTITMTNAADSLVLHGGLAQFQGGSETGLMTAGTIIDHSPNLIINGTDLDETGGSQTLIMDSTAFQTLTQLTAATPGHGINNLTMRGTGSKGFSGDQWITGTLLFDATMTGPGNVQGSYNIHVNTLVDNSSGIAGGAFQGSTALHMTGTTPFNRDTLVVNTLYIDHGQTFALSNNLVTNYIVVDSGSTLSLNGHTVNLQGNYFTTQNGGMLSMINPSDSLVANQLYFNGGSTQGLLTAGGINLTGPVAGAIYQGFIGQHIAASGSPSPTAFAPSGTRVWLNPSFSTFMEFANPGSGASGSHFWFLQPKNGAPVNLLTNIVVDSLLLGEVSGATFQSDSVGTSGIRTITTNGIFNSTDTLTLSAVNVVLTGSYASTANKLKWTGFNGAGNYNGTLFTQNRSTNAASLDQNNFSLVTLGSGFYVNNTGAAGLTLGLGNIGPTLLPICIVSLLSGGHCP